MKPTCAAGSTWRPSSTTWRWFGLEPPGTAQLQGPRRRADILLRHLGLTGLKDLSFHLGFDGKYPAQHGAAGRRRTGDGAPGCCGWFPGRSAFNPDQLPAVAPRCRLRQRPPCRLGQNPRLRSAPPMACWPSSEQSARRRRMPGVFPIWIVCSASIFARTFSISWTRRW